MARASTRANRTALATSVAIVVLALTNCSGSDDDSGDSARDTASSPDGSTSTTLDPEQTAVLKDYEAYWTTLLDLSNPPAPDSDELAKHAIGEELARAHDAVTARAEAGESLQGRYLHDASDITIDDDKAELMDCLAPEVAVHDTATGDLKTRYPTQAQSLVVELERDSDTWKVALISPNTEPCRPDSEMPSTTASTEAPSG